MGAGVAQTSWLFVSDTLLARHRFVCKLMTLAARIESFRSLVEEWLRGLYHGMITHPAYEKIEKQAEDDEDAFMLACFPDAFGIPSPVSYYTAELLPYLEDEFEAWERRMWNRGSLLERKGEQYHF